MEFVLDARYRLKADHGNEPGAANPAFHPDGVQNPDGTFTVHPLPDGQPLRAGDIGTVEAIIPAADHGDGSNPDDHVLLSFGARHVTFTEAQMAELFELAELPPAHLQVTATVDDPQPSRPFPGRAWQDRTPHADADAALLAATAPATAAAPSEEVAAQ